MDAASRFERVKQFGRKLYGGRDRTAAPKPHVGGAPMAWCVFVTAVGVFALAGSTWMLAVFIAGAVGHIDWYSDYRATQEGVVRWEWDFSASIHWFNAIGLWLLCLAIGVWNAVWIEVRKHIPPGSFKIFITGLGLATALFMIAGGVVVQQRSTDARARDEVIASQSAQVGATTAQSRLTRAEQRLREMRNHENQYMAVAATVGAAEFERTYLSASQRASETPDRVRLLERSLGAARQADALESEIANLQDSVAVAQTTAVTATAVTVRADGWMGQTATFIEDLRKPVTSVLGELLAASAFSIALAAWATRQRARDMAAATALPEELQLEDHSEEEPIAAQPYDDAKREEFYDGETGEKLVKVRQKAKEYLRKAPKGKKHAVETTEAPEGDEVGVFDASRTGRSEDDAQTVSNEPEAAEAQQEIHTPDSTTLTAEQEAAYQAALDAAYAIDLAEAEPEAEAEEPGSVALPAGEGVMLTDEADAAMKALRERAYREELEDA